MLWGSNCSLTASPCLYQEEEFYITATTGPEEASGSYGESGELEKPLLPVEPVTLGPHEESGFPEEWVTIIPPLKEG